VKHYTIEITLIYVVYIIFFIEYNFRVHNLVDDLLVRRMRLLNMYLNCGRVRSVAARNGHRDGGHQRMMVLMVWMVVMMGGHAGTDDRLGHGLVVDWLRNWKETHVGYMSE
jgi:hypothetical protein